MLSSLPGFRCSLSALVWSMVAWIILIHIYTAINPKPDTPVLQMQVSGLPLHREIEEIEEKRYGLKPRSKNIPSNSGKRKGKKFSPVYDFFNIARGSFLFPDRSLAMKPLWSEGNDTGYFYPGREWWDTDGKPIQAHGGGILYVEETGTFYWYGENKDGQTYRAHKRGAARVPRQKNNIEDLIDERSRAFCGTIPSSIWQQLLITERSLIQEIQNLKCRICGSYKLTRHCRLHEMLGFLIKKNA